VKHPKLYDRLVAAGGKLLAKADEFYEQRLLGNKAFNASPRFARGRGEARMSALVGPYTTGRYGPRQWDKYEQVRHYRSWVYRCVKFLAEGTRGVPEVVKVTAAGERERHGVATKAWRGAGCEGEPPAYRNFLSRVRQKAAVGPIKPHEEYEFLPDDHPAVRLLNDPNEPYTGVKFWQLVGTYEELTGESFIWVVENAAGTPVELWCLPSQWVTPRNEGRSGMLVDYFEVRAVNGPVEVFAPEEIIWSKDDNPWHPLYTTSPVQTAATTIDAYEMTEIARYAGLENGTMAGGAISVPADVTVDQTIIDRLEARFLAKFGGVANAGRPLILEGGLQWAPPPAGIELAFTSSEDQLRKYIMAHFGLDEAMMGFSNASTYAAAVITKQSLRDSVYGPRLQNRAATLTERLLPRFGPNLRALYLPDEATAGLDPDAKRADWQLAVGAGAVTKNEIRTQFLSLEPSEDPAADELPSDPMAALGGGDMAGWDDEPGQEKPGGGVPRPGFDVDDKGLNGNGRTHGLPVATKAAADLDDEVFAECLRAAREAMR
jgi:HK97 family phage portal protein